MYLIQKRKLNKQIINLLYIMPEIGEPAPDFKLVDQDGNERKLSDFKDKNLILAFYSFDFSPVCTTEFECFQDDLKKLNNLNVQVLGISVDSKYSHKQFSEKLGLNFPLLSDFGREVSKLYGTLRQEGFSNRAYFIIDKEGIVRFKHIMPTPKERLENEKLIEELNIIHSTSL